MPTLLLTIEPPGHSLRAACWLALRATIRSSLTKAVPDIKIDSIGRSPVDGLYEVMVGSQIMMSPGTAAISWMDGSSTSRAAQGPDRAAPVRCAQAPG